MLYCGPSRQRDYLIAIAVMPRLLFIVLVLCALARVSQGAAGSAVSANGRSAVELSRTPEGKLLEIVSGSNEQKTCVTTL